MTTRWTRRHREAGLAGGSRAESNDRVEAGYGRCSRRSCPGFRGNGYTCSRGGCGHHYDSHW
jgi:hypothetical protein